jgi:CheY-like chemotaxis protein
LHPGARVLFVDDEETLVDAMGRLLQHMGYGVRTATDPRRALELFREAPGEYDVVITDQTMPNMTGVELTREILRLDPAARVVVCSGFDPNLDEAKAKEAGAARFINKPIRGDALARLLREVLAA